MSSASGVTPAGGPRITGAPRPRPPPPPPPGTWPPRPACAAAATASAISTAKANAPKNDRALMRLSPTRACSAVIMYQRTLSRGLDLQYRAECLVRQGVDEALGPRLHFTDALLQLRQENLAADRLALRVEKHALDVLS